MKSEKNSKKDSIKSKQLKNSSKNKKSAPIIGRKSNRNKKLNKQVKTKFEIMSNGLMKEVKPEQPLLNKKRASDVGKKPKESINESKQMKLIFNKRSTNPSTNHSNSMKKKDEKINLLAPKLKQKEETLITSSETKDEFEDLNKIIIYTNELTNICKNLKKRSAKDNNFKLQSNPHLKIEHIVNIQELRGNVNLTNADILLALLEIGENAEYYQICYSNNSKYFWADIIQYEDLKCIFTGYSGETLRKYWRYLTQLPQNVYKVAEIVKSNKKLLDDRNSKLLSIIYAIAHLLEGKITSLGEVLVDRNKKNNKNEKIIYPGTNMNETCQIKEKYLTEFVNCTWCGTNYKESADEVFEGRKLNPPEIDCYTQLLQWNKRKTFLKQLSQKDVEFLQRLNDEETFIFSLMDNLVDKLKEEFPILATNYILNVLDLTSMNIELTYKFFSDPKNYQNLLFSTLEDDIILNKKGSEEYSLIVQNKGKEKVEEREDYLLG